MTQSTDSIFNILTNKSRARFEPMAHARVTSCVHRSRLVTSGEHRRIGLRCCPGVSGSRLGRPTAEQFVYLMQAGSSCPLCPTRRPCLQVCMTYARCCRSRISAAGRGPAVCRHPSHAQPVAPLRERHYRRPRLPPRRCTDQAPSRDQRQPGVTHGRSNAPIASQCFVRRCPRVHPLFASWPWLLHTGCSLEAIDMTVHERNR